MKAEGLSRVSFRRSALLVVLAWITLPVFALPEPVFHLNFVDFEDVSESGLEIIAKHEQRHLLQAERIRAHAGFPTG